MQGAALRLEEVASRAEITEGWGTSRTETMRRKREGGGTGRSSACGRSSLNSPFCENVLRVKNETEEGNRSLP